MPKYLCQGSYTEHGLKGLVKEGGSKRQAVVEQLVKEMGGKVEAFYFAFGGDDFFDPQRFAFKFHRLGVQILDAEHHGPVRRCANLGGLESSVGIGQLNLRGLLGEARC